MCPVAHDVVLLADIDAAAAAAVASKLGPADRFVAAGCDVTSEASIAELVSRAAEAGVVRTVVNNAGAARATSLHETTPEIWRADNALNLEAAFLCFRAFEPMLKASKGSVVNIASVNGMVSPNSPRSVLPGSASRGNYACIRIFYNTYRVNPIGCPNGRPSPTVRAGDSLSIAIKNAFRPANSEFPAQDVGEFSLLSDRR